MLSRRSAVLRPPGAMSGSGRPRGWAAGGDAVERGGRVRAAGGTGRVAKPGTDTSVHALRLGQRSQSPGFAVFEKSWGTRLHSWRNTPLVRASPECPPGFLVYYAGCGAGAGERGEHSHGQSSVQILLLHGFRHLGLMFLAPGGTYAGIPPQFAYPAAFGDLLTAILALAAIPGVMRSARGGRLLLWIFNVVGTVDLIAAIVLAAMGRQRTWARPTGFPRSGFLRCWLLTTSRLSSFVSTGWRRSGPAKHDRRGRRAESAAGENPGGTRLHFSVK